MFDSWNFFATEGDIAVDDMKFVGCAEPLPPSSCPTNTFKCNSGHCVPTANKCDYAPDCCDYSDESDKLCTKYLRYCGKCYSEYRSNHTGQVVKTLIGPAGN